MSRETTMRTRERMSIPDARKTTSRTGPRSISRVDHSNSSRSLDLIADHANEHTIRPDREPSIPGFASMLPLVRN